MNRRSRKMISHEEMHERWKKERDDQRSLTRFWFQKLMEDHFVKAGKVQSHPEFIFAWGVSLGMLIATDPKFIERYYREYHSEFTEELNDPRSQP